MKRIIIAFVALLMMTSSVIAQIQIERQALTIAGGELLGGSLVVSQSIGQTATATLQDENRFLTQGFQQPTSGVTNTSFVTTVNELRLYPNPTVDYANVQFITKEALQLNWELYNVTGQVLSRNKEGLQEGENLLTYDLKPYPAGLYFLKLTDDSGALISTLRIVLQ